ncbi:hypothetical protein GTY88_07935 [Streptomyces sp. SID5926]|nr:hypothetical protein [Streptomyces sp. SID5926]
MGNSQKSRELTPDENFRELYKRFAKLNDKVTALLAPAWGSELGLIPTDHPLYQGEKLEEAQEQDASVDWRAVIQRRERELKAAGEAHHAAEERAGQAEATVARVRAEVARIRSITPTWGPVADLIDAALDDPERPREQWKRPTHPDGTPYSYYEITAEGWGFCDGCGMWSTASPERPHQCSETHIQGPIVGSARIALEIQPGPFDGSEVGDA